jgi:hypothetical protein
MYSSKNNSIFEKLRTRSFLGILANDIVAGSGSMQLLEYKPDMKH